MNVTIIIPGKAPRNLNFEHGETLADLVSRVANAEFPIHKVQTWYDAGSGAPIGSASSFSLTEGMQLAGTPKVDGGRA
jgi:hypothetical protein